MALRQLAAEARERRTAVPWSARPVRPPAQPHADPGEHEGEEDLGDAHGHPVTGEPRR
jgi:hypothetical protein